LADGVQQVKARRWLDEGELDTMCGFGMGEDHLALGEWQWPLGKEGHTPGCHVLHVLLYVRDFERDVIDAFSSSLDELGDGASSVIRGNQAYGSISDIESGTFEPGVCIAFRSQHSGACTQDTGIGGDSDVEVCYCYANVKETLYHLRAGRFSVRLSFG